MAPPDHPTRSVIDVDTNSPAGAGHAWPQTHATDRYTLGDEINRGGMGIIYRAADAVLRREVAVKVLQEKYGPESGVARRFADEARITGQLQHPSIPPVHDLGTLPDGRPFLAMKLIKGQSLEESLKVRPDPSAQRGRFVAVFEQICQALGYAHSHNVIHRDLKPANVMVGNFGEVQVMDWGLAKVLGTGAPAIPTETANEETRAWTEIIPTPEAGSHTQAGSLVGTPAFAPPEQALGEIAKVNTRSDVFGLGAILAVILTGKPPYVGDSAESVRVMAVRGKLDDCFARLAACGAEPDLLALCTRCLAFEPADRPANAGEVAKAVAELRAAADERARRAELERVRVEGEQATAAARAAERRKRRRLGIGAAAVLAAVVIGGLTALVVVQQRANKGLAAEQAKVEARNKELANEKARALVAEQEAHVAEAEAQKEKARALAAEKDAERQAVAARNSAAIAEAVNNFLCNDVLAQANPLFQFGPDKKPDPNLSLRTVLDRAAAKIPGRFSDQPLVEAAIRFTIGQTYGDLGMTEAAEPHLHAALELLRRHRGENDQQTMMARLRLSSVYYELNKLAPMEEMLTPLLAYQRREYGMKDQRTLATLNQLGLCYQELKKFEQAEACYLEAYESRRKYFGETNLATLNSLNSLGWFYYDGVKQYERAEPIYIKALELRRKVLPKNHPWIQNSVRSLAMLDDALGKYDGAETLYRESLEICRASVGEKNARTLTAMRELGRFLAYRGRFNEAEPLLRMALELSLGPQGDEFVGTYLGARDLSICLLLKGETAEALELARRFDTSALANNKNYPIDVGVAKDLLGSILNARAQYQAAESALVKGLEVYEKHEPDGWMRYSIAARLGESLAQQKKFAQAEPLLLTGYEGMNARITTIPAPKKKRIREAGEQIVRLYEAWGMPAKAKEWRERLDAKLPGSRSP